MNWCLFASKKTGLESVKTEADPRRRQPGAEEARMSGVFALKPGINHPS
jgi:hypothetical protein